MKFTRQSLYQLRCDKGLITDQNGETFDAVRYSQFKYGLGNAAEHYARQMTDFLLFTHPYWFEHSTVGITSSAYKYVPTASDSIANSLVNLLQPTLSERFADTKLKKFKISRTRLFDSDYGNLTEQQRQELMQQTDLWIDQPQNWTNKRIIVIDDVWITGAHENRIRNLFRTTKVAEVLFLYIAEIPQPISPRIEHLLNHAWVDNLLKLKPLFESPCFQLNARICKFLMSYPDQLELVYFLEQLSPEKLLKIQEAICGDGYNEMVAYRQNYQILESMVTEIAFS